MFTFALPTPMPQFRLPKMAPVAAALPDTAGAKDRFVASAAESGMEDMKKLRAWSMLSPSTQTSLQKLGQERQAQPAGYDETGLIATGDGKEVYSSLGRLSALVEQDARAGGDRPTGNVVADVLLEDAGKTSQLGDTKTLVYGEVRYRDAQGKLVRQSLEADDFHHRGGRALLQDQTLTTDQTTVRSKEGLLTSVKLEGKEYSLLGLDKTPFDRLPKPLQTWLEETRDRDTSRLLAETKLLTHGGAGQPDKQGRVQGEKVDLSDPAQVRAYRDRVQSFQKDHAQELTTYPDPRLEKELKQLDKTLGGQERIAQEGRMQGYETDFGKRLGESLQKAPEGSDMRRLSELLVAQSWAKDPHSEYHDKVDADKVNKNLSELLSKPAMAGQLEALRQQSLHASFPDLKGASSAQARYMDSGEFQERLQKLPPDQRDAAITKELSQLNTLDPKLAQEQAAKIASQRLQKNLQALSPADRDKALAELRAVDPELAHRLAENGTDSGLAQHPLLESAKVGKELIKAGEWKFVEKLSEQGKKLLKISDKGGSGVLSAGLGRVMGVYGLVKAPGQLNEAFEEFNHHDNWGGAGKLMVVEGGLMLSTAALGLAAIPGVGWVALGAIGVGLAVDALFGKTSQEEMLERVGVNR